jgi:hypothetical protein
MLSARVFRAAFDNVSDPGIGSHPIDVAVLTDYWLAALAEADEAVVESHLLECDPCGARLREVTALAEGIRRLACEGCLRRVASDTFLQRAKADGLRVREYARPPEEVSSAP